MQLPWKGRGSLLPRYSSTTRTGTTTLHFPHQQRPVQCTAKQDYKPHHAVQVWHPQVWHPFGLPYLEGTEGVPDSRYA